MMTADQVEILLIEDDPRDVRLTLRALERENVRNRVEVTRDEEKAPDFVFCRGSFTLRSLTHTLVSDGSRPSYQGIRYGDWIVEAYLTCSLHPYVLQWVNSSRQGDRLRFPCTGEPQDDYSPAPGLWRTPFGLTSGRS